MRAGFAGDYVGTPAGQPESTGCTQKRDAGSWTEPCLVTLTGSSVLRLNLSRTSFSARHVWSRFVEQGAEVDAGSTTSSARTNHGVNPVLKHLTVPAQMAQGGSGLARDAGRDSQRGVAGLPG